MDDVKVVEVRLWNESAGAVAPLQGKPGFYEFQYAAAFEKSGLELSPLVMKKSKRRFSFPALAQDTFHGLPGLLADALPDKFGNALIDEYLIRHGVRAGEITTLQRLVYVGRRAMGALEFEPAVAETRTPAVIVPLDMAHLVEDARRALRGDLGSIAQEIMDIGSSAGGARAAPSFICMTRRFKSSGTSSRKRFAWIGCIFRTASIQPPMSAAGYGMQPVNI